MAIDLDKLYNWPFEEIEQSYTARDSIIYALGLGFNSDPVREEELNFTFEERNFKAVPTMAAVLCSPGFWLRNPKSGITWQKVLHGEQAIELHQSLPPVAAVKAFVLKTAWFSLRTFRVIRCIRPQTSGER